MRRLWWRLTYRRWEAGANAAFDGVLDCLDVLDRHTLATDEKALKNTEELRFVIKQMKKC
ncbi:MAG: hypothetical protein ACJAZ1_002083 [Yoonia sp.]|jgi:hypothetical protein